MRKLVLGLLVFTWSTSFLPKLPAAQYEAVQSAGTAGSEATPIDASSAQPIQGPGIAPTPGDPASVGETIEGTGLQVGAAEKAPLPTPLDSDGDGYMNYAEYELGTDPYNAANYPDMLPAEAHAKTHDGYETAVEAGTGQGTLYGIDKGRAAGKGAQLGVKGSAPSTSGKAAQAGAKKNILASTYEKYPAATIAGGAVVVIGGVALASSGGGGGGDSSSSGTPAAGVSGSFSGGWGGRCSDGSSVGGGFSATVSAGRLSGSYSGDDSGGIAGTVSESGSISARGTAGGIASWSGSLSGSGSSMSGSGRWSGSGCSGSWSGN